MSTKKKKKLNKKVFFAFIIDLLLLGSTGLTAYFILKLTGIETTLRIMFIIAYSLMIFMILIDNIRFGKRKKKIKYLFLIVFSIILIGANAFTSYSLNKVYSTLEKVSNTKEMLSLSLVTLKTNNVKIAEIEKSDKIGSLSESTMSSLIDTCRSENNLTNEIIYFDTYFEIYDNLKSGKIKYAFLPTDYSSIFASQENYESAAEDLKILKTIEKENEEEKKTQKKVTEPITVLFLGVDTLTSTYNADTILLVTFNPKTLSATMLSIPRDSYTTISCSGKKTKINASGWGGDKCVVKTVENYLDVDIDYYAKMNFKGMVELVDSLGGIEVDVPYTFCEQNSKRKWGKNTVYVNKGKQKLNGEQALALTRNRHYWNGQCASKYTKEGTRNDFTRGQNQQLVFKAILNKMKEIDNIDTIYKLLDSLGKNMKTDMSTDTILSFYNVGKDILLKLSGGNKDISKIINIQKLKFTSYTTTIKVGSLNLSMVVNYEDSITAVSNAMKVNLGLKKATAVKTFNYNVNDGYEEKVIGAKEYGGSSNITTLPNFVGKTYTYAKGWLETYGIAVDIEYKTSSKYSDGVVISQSEKANVDITNISKIKLVVAKKNSSTTQTTFTYSSCLEDSGKDNSKCLVKSYVGSDISTFKNWVSSTGLNIPVEYYTKEGTNNNITGQNISGITLYDLINGGKTLEITYNVKTEETSKEENEN